VEGNAFFDVARIVMPKCHQASACSERVKQAYFGHRHQDPYNGDLTELRRGSTKKVEGQHILEPIYCLLSLAGKQREGMVVITRLRAVDSE